MAAFSTWRVGMTMSSWILSLSLAVIDASAARMSAPSAAMQANSCQASALQDLLPEVVAPMLGAPPAWLVDGSATWKSDEPVKTLWVLLRTSREVRVEGRRLDAPGVLTLKRGEDPPAAVLVITNPARHSAIPGGAPPEIMRTYVFLPSTVFYPSPGCWEFTVRIGEEEVRIVRDLKPKAGLDEK
jgi:hypothetical protein